MKSGISLLRSGACFLIILKFIKTSLYPKKKKKKKAKSLIKIQMNGYQIKFAIEVIGELSYNNSIKIYLR